jgi:hypothetical protein
LHVAGFLASSREQRGQHDDEFDWHDGY